ncbi:hypothetical protein FJR48_02195 [Sulfurimonas lithotrophica]|uniref:DUF2846 domain-containing protein n=1 Tax=Sulfurimonas lithotrophica TaxID=2590022 RepID=A0A5P8NYT7_9BACT|nr:hypothetical protein [Sulfurimonas lithotrophica]QFR48599.1 hypothetical protein FJR48_02195 [Sulfurimonas lithotrophica]
MKNLLLIIVFITSLLFSGCTMKQDNLEVNYNAVKNYRLPVEVTDNETLVYVIRDKAFTGSAWSVWIGLNDKIIASLDAGEYTYFKVKDGINTINTVLMKHGRNYFALDKKRDKPVFIKCNIATGKFEEIASDLGMTYISKYKEVKLLPKPKPNDGYDNGNINLAMYSNLNMMIENNESIKPDQNHGVLTFIRSSDRFKVLNYSIWDDNGIVCNLDTDSFCKIRVPKGKHFYYVFSERSYVLEVDVESNENYNVKLDIGMGWAAAYTKLTPLNENTKLYRNITEVIGRDLVSSREITKTKVINFKQLRLREPIDDGVKFRISKGLKMINKTKQAVLSGTKETKKFVE